MYYTNGEKYIGDWKNDLRHGIGTYYYNNGKLFEGQWIND